MRNPNRIFDFCSKLAEIWHDNCPDWRFGQLMSNVLGKMCFEGGDPFFPEDNEMLEYFENYFKN